MMVALISHTSVFTLVAGALLPLLPMIYIFGVIILTKKYSSQIRALPSAVEALIFGPALIFVMGATPASLIIYAGAITLYYLVDRRSKTWSFQIAVGFFVASILLNSIIQPNHGFLQKERVSVVEQEAVDGYVLEVSVGWTTILTEANTVRILRSSAVSERAVCRPTGFWNMTLWQQVRTNGTDGDKSRPVCSR